MTAESFIGLSSMENDIKMLSSEKPIIENERDNFKMSIMDTEKETIEHTNERDDTIDKCNSLSFELEKAILSENEVRMLLAENTKLKNDNLMLLAEHGELIHVKSQFEDQLVKITDLQKNNEELVLANSELQNHITKIQGEKSKVLASIVDLECQLEVKVQQISNLQDTIKELQAEKVELNNEVMKCQEEITTTLAQLQQTEACLKSLENQLQQQLEKNSDMTNDIAILDMKLVDVRRSFHAKIATLHEEKDASLLELQASKALVRNFESIIEKQSLDISYLQQANDELKNNINILTEESEQAKAMLDKQLVEVKRSLHAKILALHKENNVALLELQTSQASIGNLESVVKMQKENISSLQQANDEMQKTLHTLTEQSEQAKAMLQEKVTTMTSNVSILEKQLVELRKSSHSKIATLHEEKAACLFKLHAAEASVRNFESVVGEQNDKISSLEQANDELQKVIYTITKESEQAKSKSLEELKDMRKNNIVMLEKQLVEVRKSSQAKITALNEEKNAILLELHTSQSFVRNLENVVGQQKEKNLSLQQENSELQKTIHILTEELEQTKDRLDKQLVEVKRSLHAKITLLHEEKNATLFELKASKASMRNFESMVQKQNEKILSLQQANDELLKTVHILTKDSEGDKSAMDKQLVEVKRSLHAKITTLHEEKNATLLELHASQASVRNFESVVQKQNENILSLQQANDKLHKTIHILIEESEKAKAAMDKQLVEVKRSLHAKVTSLHVEKNAALLELQASQTSIRSFEGVAKMENENTSSLQQTNDKLQKTIDILTKELEQARSTMDKQLMEVKRSLHAKIASLHEEKNATLLELQTSQASVRNYEGLVKMQNKNITSLQQAKAMLQEEVTTMANNVNMLEKQLVELRKSLHSKIAILHQEKDASLVKLQATRASSRNFECMVEEQNDKILSLQQANDELQKVMSTLTEESEQAKSMLLEELKDMRNNNIATLEKQLVEVRRNLHAKNATLYEEKNATLLELHTSHASIRNLENVLQQQKEKNLSLQQANGELQKTIHILAEELEQAKVRFDKQLVEVKKSLHAKNTILHEEKNVALLELEAFESSMRNFESVVQKQNEQILSLQQANDESQKHIHILNEESDQTKATMDKRLVAVKRSLHAKIAALHGEKNAALLELQASQMSINQFEGVLKMKNENILSLQQANDQLQKTIDILTKESKQARSTMDKQLVEVKRSLHAKIATLHEEKNAALLELQMSQASIRNTEDLLKMQNENITSMQQANDEMQKTICTLTEKSEKANAILQEEATTMKNNVSTLEKQLVELRKSLHSKITTLHQEKDASLVKLHATQAFVRNFESVVEEQNDKISSLQQANDELQKVICTLIEQSEQAKSKLLEELKDMRNDSIARLEKQLVEVRRSLNAKITALHEEKNKTLLELHASQASARNFESVVQKQNENILSLEQANDKLQKTIHILIDESAQAKATMDKQLVEVKRSIHAKITGLHEEKNAALLELQASQASVRNFEGLVKMQNENISSLQKTNDEMQKTICTLTTESEQAKAKLHEKLKSTQEEQDIVITRLKLSESMIKNLENEVARLIKELSVQLENNSTLDKQLEQATSKVSSLMRKLRSLKLKWLVISMI